MQTRGGNFIIFDNVLELKWVVILWDSEKVHSCEEQHANNYQRFTMF